MTFHRRRKGWHPAHRARMPLVRLLPPTLEPATLPPGTSGESTGGPSGNDLDQLAAATTSMVWSNLSSVRYNVTQLAGKVSAVADGRTGSPGYSVAQATGSKQPSISGAGASLVLTTDGVSTCLVSALQAALDNSQTCIGMMGVLTLVDPPATRGAFHFPMCISTSSNVPGIFLARDSEAINPEVGDAYVYFDDSSGSLAHVDPIAQVAIGTEAAAGMRTLWGKRTLVLMWRTATTYFWCVPPYPVVSQAAGAAATAGHCLLAIGTDGTGTLFDGNQYRAWGTFTATALGPSSADIASILQWATANEFCLNDP